MTAPEPMPTPEEGRPSYGTSTGLDPRVAGLLAYLFGWVSGLILYLIEKDHPEVRYHAAQSILVSVAVIALYIPISILGFIPVIGLLFWLAGLVLGLASLGLWIYLIIQGYNLNHVRLPIVGGMAEQWAAK